MAPTTPTETRMRHVRRVIERRITSGAVGPDGRLPSTRTLARELGVSRFTVLAALDVLVAEGYVETRPRSGLFASPHLQGSPRSPHRSGADRVDWGSRLPQPDADLTSRPQSSWWTARYPFLTGQPDPASFPAAAWLRALRQAHEPRHLAWSLTEHGGDDPLLVEQIVGQLLPPRGLECDPEQVVVTLGSQQALCALAQLLLRPGDRAIVEEPGYPDARAIVRSRGAELISALVDDEGFVVNGSLDGAALVYITPSHQHPTNVTMSLQRRIQLLDAAARADAVIVEDDYDSELRYEGAPSPALASLDRSGRTVYLGTFSKFLAPGLRVGYLVADAELAAAVRAQVRLVARQVPGPLQRALALFIRGGDYARTLGKRRAELRARWNAARDAVTEHLPCDGAFPPGGTSLWIRTDGPVDWRDVVAPAARRGILLQPPEQHWAHPPFPLNTLRLGFSAIPLERIFDGVAELAEVHAAVGRAQIGGQ